MSRIVGPMEKRLTLPRTTIQTATRTVAFQLAEMPADRSPAFDLTQVIGATSPRIISAIPLKPAARIFRINPAIFPPNDERLRSVHPKKVELGVVPLRAKLRPAEPTGRKLPRAIGHVFPAEDAECEHLLGRELRFEFRPKAAAGWFGPPIRIAVLHSITNDHTHRLHFAEAESEAAARAVTTPESRRSGISHMRATAT